MDLPIIQLETLAITAGVEAEGDSEAGVDFIQAEGEDSGVDLEVSDLLVLV